MSRATVQVHLNEWLARFLKIVVGIVLAAIFSWCALWLFMMVVLRGSNKNLESAEVAHQVAGNFMIFSEFGSIPARDHAGMMDYLERRIEGIHGYTESDGFHGDGTDWYEVELAPELAAQLRAALATSRMKRSTQFPDDSAMPSWWPREWPRDVECYEKDFRYFIMTPSGTRVWFMGVWM